MTDTIATEVKAPIERLALSPVEAAEALGVSHSWLHTKIMSEDLKSHRVGGRRLILIEDLRAFVESGTVGAAS